MNNNFAKIWDTGSATIRTLDFTARMYTVFFYLIENMHFKNWVYTPQSKIAEDLHFDKADVNKIMKKFVQKRVCIPIPRSKSISRGYILNPELAFKGDAEEFQDCYGKFLNAERDYDEQLEKQNTVTEPPKSDTSTEKVIQTLREWLNKSFTEQHGIKRNDYIAVYPDKFREFLVEHGYSESVIKQLADEGILQKYKHQLTKPIKIAGKSTRMYCLQPKVLEKQTTHSGSATPKSATYFETESIKQLKLMLTQSQKYGDNKKNKVLEYLQQRMDKHNTVTCTLKQITDDTGIGKLTLINFFQWLEEHKVISRPKRGQIVVNKQYLQWVSSSG